MLAAPPPLNLLMPLKLKGRRSNFSDFSDFSVGNLENTNFMGSTLAALAILAGS